MTSTRRIVICGGAYSDNLGDAIIADCLSYGIKHCMPDAEIVKLDLAGRQGPGRMPIQSKGILVKVLNALPRSFAQYFVLTTGSVLLKMRIEPVWNTYLRANDSIVIGGGQLFQDDLLNYPLKLWWLNRTLVKMNDVVAVYAVGVGEAWSWLSQNLFASTLRNKNLKYISTRDNDSKEHLERHLPFLREASVYVDPDPALLAESVYSDVVKNSSKRFDVGISLMDVQSLGNRSSQSKLSSTVTSQWNLLIDGLVARGLSVALFTNGAQEDEEYLAHIARGYLRKPNVTILKQATTASDYVTYIAQMRAVIAHRLHASIVGYSLRVPTIGLKWDPKLEQFYTMCSRSEWLFDLSVVSADHLINRVLLLLDSVVDPAMHRNLMGRTWGGIRRLSDHI